MHNLTHRTIILTGATGFLGSFLMAALLEQGYKVMVLGRSSKGKKLANRLSDIVRWFNTDDPGERLQSLEVDFTKKHLGLDEPAYRSLCSVRGKIIHCASDTSFAERNRERVLAANVESLPALLDFSADAGTEHLYYVSTAYAAGICEGVCMETPPAADAFTNVYEESKTQAEKIISGYCSEKDMPLSILRPSIVYGHSKTGISLRFNALYYPVKSLLSIRDIFIKDITEQGGAHSVKLGISRGDDGILTLPIDIFLPERGSVNLIPVDFFVETAIGIIEHPESEGIYHITSDNPPDMAVLLEYSERFLGLRGIRLLWNPSDRKPVPSPADELFDKFIEPYRPYLSDRRIFDRSRIKGITPGLSAPSLTYEIFERCMTYAVGCNWGK